VHHHTQCVNVFSVVVSIATGLLPRSGIVSSYNSMIFSFWVELGMEL
jgi:hypothetical protein